MIVDKTRLVKTFSNIELDMKIVIKVSILLPRLSGLVSSSFGTWKGMGFRKLSLLEETDPLSEEAPDLGWTVAKLVGEKVEGKETAEGALDLILSVTCSSLSTRFSGSALRHCNTHTVTRDTLL